MQEQRTYRQLPCARQLGRLAVCDVLEQAVWTSSATGRRHRYRRAEKRVEEKGGLYAKQAAEATVILAAVLLYGGRAAARDGGSVDRTDGHVTAKVYTGQESAADAFTGATATFAVDQTELILDRRNFSEAIPTGWTVSSLAFYPTDGSSEWSTVFWYSEGSNGKAHDKLNANNVFRVLHFTSNGGFGSPAPRAYQVLSYVGNRQAGDACQELYCRSDETFTITGAMGSGELVINTTSWHHRSG